MNKENLKKSIIQIIKSYESYLKKQIKELKKYNGEIDYIESEENKVTKIGIVIEEKEYTYNVKKDKITGMKINE